MSLTVAVVIICVVILFASAIRKFLGEWFKVTVVAWVLCGLWYWSGIRRDVLLSTPGVIGVVVVSLLIAKLPQIEAAIKRMHGASTQVGDNTQSVGAFARHDTAIEARLRRQHERGMISDEEFERRLAELQEKPPAQGGVVQSRKY